MKRRFLATCLIGSAFAASLACSSAKDRSDRWMLLVQRAHHGVDEYRSGEERSSANGALLHSTEQALERAIAEAPSAPDVRERWVIQDLYYRLAQLLTDNGATARAVIEVERGLAVDAAPTLARANLLALHGKILEKQGEREAAAKAYHAALLVNEVLMDRALNGSAEQGSVQP